MPLTAGASQYNISYGVNPIILTNGVASSVLGGAISLASIMQAMSFSGLDGTTDVGQDLFAAQFYPVPGSTLVDNQIGSYPFANLAIAANAIINQPLRVSLLMRVPASVANGGYGGKLSLMTALQNTLAQHIQNEGTFVVATPSFFWTDCILLTLTDVSGGETLQPQTEWRWDFVKPLITQSQAAATQNNAMSAISSGGPTDGGSDVTGDPSSVTSALAQPAASSAAAAGVPATLNPGALNALAGAS